MQETPPPGIFGKVYRIVQLAAAAVAFFGIANTGLTLWMLDKITSTAARVEAAKAEVVEELGKSENRLSREIVAISTALGTDPQAIQEAALAIKNGKAELEDLTVKIRQASVSITDLEMHLRSLSDDVASLKMTIQILRTG